MVDGDSLRRSERVDARARRVDVGGDLLRASQPAVAVGRGCLLREKFGGTVGDLLHKLIADIDAERVDGGTF